MVAQRRVYLDDIPLDEAERRLNAALDVATWECPTPGEDLPVADALGRVTAASVWAKNSSPHYQACAMDGIAVRAAETIGATETAPLRLRVGDQAVWVDTGDPLPDGFDAVIMIEQVQALGDDQVEI